MTKFDSLKPKSFEEYLGYVFMEDEPESAGVKETFEENFDRWLGWKTPESIVELAELWGNKTF